MTAFVFFVFFISYTNTTSANPITEDSARVKAEYLLSYQRTTTGKRIKSVETQPKVVCVERGAQENESPTYYIFRRQKGTGFAIIAGDDSMPTLLGYSLENNIDIDNMPDALRIMLNNYDLHVKLLRANSKASANGNVGPLEPGEPIVGPYIKTKWNQREPYNWLTPNDRDKQTPTGCVPTAAAQILNYYKYPNIYHIYNWDLMLEKYSDNYSHAEGMVVATLMRDLGALMDTDYSSSGSGTGDNYFRIPGLVNKSYDSDSLKTELIDKGPLVVHGWGPTKNSTEHAFIVDGYDSNGYYHVNWGWGGSYDGYYKELSLHSPGWGTSVYFFKPDLENPAAIPAAYGGVSINAKASKSGHKVVITLHQVRLATGNKFNGYIGYRIYKVSKSQFNNYTEGFYGDEDYQYGYSGFSNPSIQWNSDQQETDINVEIDLGKISENGYYVFVPRYYNLLERSHNWRPLIQFADGTLAEDIPFEYKDGEFFFKDVPCGDFDIDVSQIVTAPTYYEKERSGIQINIENNGSNNFTGILTAKFENKDDTKDIKTRDFDLYLAANKASQQILYTRFNFTGNYSLKEIEIWQTLPSNERKIYLHKLVEKHDFSILPEDFQVSLKLNNMKQTGNLYQGVWNYVEAEIENVSNNDFNYSNLYRKSYLSNNYVDIAPYRIMAGEKATVYPRLWGSDNNPEEQFFYKTNNGLYDSYYPIEGTFNVSFMDKPEKNIGTSGIAFYYKNRMTEKPSIGFYSEGTIKRSLWKNGEKIKDFSDIQTDNTYNTYRVCPDGSELKDMPVGNYMLQLILTDVDSYVWPAVHYPLVIDEEDLPISIEKIIFDKDCDIHYDGEIPVFVTIMNPTDQEITTVVGTEIYKQGEEKQSWWADNLELHSVYLPAMQSTIVRLSCHIISQNSNLKGSGTFKVYASPCRTKRGSGHLDFGSSKGSDSIELPYTSTGIDLNTNNKKAMPTTYYGIDGKRVNNMSHGLYIIRHSDGTVKKCTK